MVARRDSSYYHDNLNNVYCRVVVRTTHLGPGGGTQTLVTGATTLHFNPLNYSWDIYISRHIFNSSLKGRCVSRDKLLYVSYVWRRAEVSIPIPLTRYPQFSRLVSRPLELTLHILFKLSPQTLM